MNNFDKGKNYNRITWRYAFSMKKQDTKLYVYHDCNYSLIHSTTTKIFNIYYVPGNDLGTEVSVMKIIMAFAFQGLRG